MIHLDKWDRLRNRLAALGIRETDLDEQFVRSSGPGGQNVNKVSSCVLLRHIPSGETVKCSQTRSQADNRYFARETLCLRIEAQRLGKESAQARERHRIREQKRKRSKRARNKIRRAKEHRAEIKSLRRDPSSDA